MHKNRAIFHRVIIKEMGLQPYQDTLKAMHTFTDEREEGTLDEIWLLEHPPVFTQGQAGKPEHILKTTTHFETKHIPLVQSDRGGQVTYHGPGQQIVYILMDLKRKKMGVRELVTQCENAVIATLADFDIQAKARADAPGVYIDERKICSLGFRIRRGCSFHGLALNVNMDLSPFLRINPCGYPNLKMTQTADLGGPDSLFALDPVLINHLTVHLGYTEVESLTMSEHPI